MSLGIPRYVVYKFRLYYTILSKEVIFNSVTSRTTSIKSIENKIYYHSNHIKISREDAEQNGVDQLNKDIEIVPDIFNRKFIPIHNDITTLVTVVHNKLYNEDITNSDIILLYNENLTKYSYEDFKKNKEYNQYIDYIREFSSYYNYNYEHGFIEKE